MNDEQRWQLMHLLVPPTELATIINRIEDGTISHSSAKIVFNHIYEINCNKLLGVEQ